MEKIKIIPADKTDSNDTHQKKDDNNLKKDKIVDKRDKAIRLYKAKKILASIGVESDKLGIDLNNSEINIKYTTYEEYLKNYENKFNGKTDDYQVSFEECSD